MKPPRPPRPAAPGSRLYVRPEGESLQFFTPGLARPAEVYGERIVATPSELLRRWDPARSKLGAALILGFEGAVPSVGDRWLYLGAASGTTASHVADLVGETGAVYAIERSLRPFARLLSVAERYPNLFPILGDARTPERYSGSIPPVDGIYSDVAQPDQVAIVAQNARWFLRTSGRVLLALKTSSMGRDRSARAHLDAAEAELQVGFEIEESVRLDRYHKGHYLISALPTRRLFSASEATRSRGDRRAG